MQARTSLFALGAALAVSASPLLAQDAQPASPEAPAAAAPAADSTNPAPKTAASLLVQKIEIQHIRPNDARGINVFESPKEPGVAFTGFKLGWGAAFTQQFQDLNHENTSTGAAKLADLGAGFNTAVANLYLDAQLAPGIRVAMTSYLSSRHHNETWVKDGYLLIDDSPIDVPALKSLMQFVTVKAGHFEINYGDSHFRRTDNGNAMYNPFVGNLIMDAFTTQIGGEVYVRHAGWMAMGAMTGGEVKGQVRSPGSRSPAYYGKVGYDRQLSDDLRVRITGSAFGQAKAANQTLYSGDRAGSRYYSVLDSATSTETAQFTSGMINPGFSKVKAFVVNPFVKYNGLELFGHVEQAKGRRMNETAERTWTQYSADAVYRFAGEKLFVGGRYNMVEGRLPGMTADIGMDRAQLGAGWFITPAILLKGEYVRQQYTGFPAADIRHGGRFNGFVVEGVVAF